MNTAEQHLTSRVEAWKASGTYETVNGHHIFVRRSGEPTGPLAVLLHGFPSSSYDWRGVIPALEAAGASVLTFDFLGFGLSDKPTDVRYSLKLQADIVEHLVAGEDATVIAHDMGESVAAELMARNVRGKLPFTIRHALFTNSSVIISKAALTPTQRLLRSPLGPLAARFVTERAFRRQLADVFTSRHPLTADEADDQWALAAYNRGITIIDKLSYVYRERVEQADRWEGAIHTWTGPLTIGWGMQDHICGEPVLDALIALHPSAAVTRWPDLGHYPQIEDPTAVARLALTVLRRSI